MSFIRTNHGITNLALFYGGVDYIVFVEGGISNLSTEQICSAAHDEQSIDCLFWHMLFRHFKFTKSVQFRAVGSKTVAKQIAVKISNSDIDKTIVAIDRDYDVITGNIISHPRVLYSFGYSWENDVWNEDMILNFVMHISGRTTLPNAPALKIASAYKNLNKFITKNIYEQYCCTQLAIEFLPTQRAQSILDHKSSIPNINTARVAKLLKDAKTKRSGMTTPAKPHFRKSFDFPGKIIKEFGYLVVMKLYKELVGSTIPKSVIDPTLIGHCKTFANLGFGKQQIKYYEASFSNLAATT